ncbi:MAG: GreA/GreB family elongation factor, partial [Burkholderiaceae bacterium]
SVKYLNKAGQTIDITIVGLDEVDPLNGKISWMAPVARALLKAYEGDEVSLNTPGGQDALEVLEIKYPA